MVSLAAEKPSSSARHDEGTPGQAKMGRGRSDREKEKENANGRDGHGQRMAQDSAELKHHVGGLLGARIVVCV